MQNMLYAQAPNCKTRTHFAGYDTIPSLPDRAASSPLALQMLPTRYIPHPSENNILIILITQQILRLRRLIRLPLLQLLISNGLIPQLLSRSRIPLLLPGYLFQPIKLLAIDLVQLRIDVFDCVFCSGDDYVFAVGVVSML